MSHVLQTTSKTPCNNADVLIPTSTDDDDYDRRPQRRRYEEPLIARVRRQLLAIAESPLKPIEEEIGSIAKVVCDNLEDQELQTGFVDLVIQLIVEQPFKTPFVAAVVLNVNTLKSEIVGQVLEKAVERTNAKIKEGDWREVKLLVKFLGALQGVLEGDGVWSVLQDVFTKAIDLQTENSEEVRPFACAVLLYQVLTTLGVDGWARAGEDHSSNHPLYHDFFVA